MEEKLMRMEQTYPQIRWWIVLTLVPGIFVLCFGGPVAAESEQADTAILAVQHEGRILVGPEGSAWKDIGQGRAVSIDPHGTKVAYCSAYDGGPQELFIHSLTSNQRELVHRAVGGERIWETAWSPDGRSLAVLMSDAEFRGYILLLTPGKKIRLSGDAPDGMQWYSLAWTAGGQAVSVHNMDSWRVIGLDGREKQATPLPELLMAEEKYITSTDLVLPSPGNADLFVYTRAVPGTPLFQQFIDSGEPNTALFLRDMRLGPQKDVRLTAVDVTVIDAAWAPDGNTLYFSGYLDRHAEEPYPFRVYRIDRDGRNMREVGRGEEISVGCRHGAQ